MLAVLNINIGHELSHKLDNFLDYSLGFLTISKNLYLHWVPEHILGHHVNVSTPLDAATSKKNQTLYAFFI